MKAFQSLFASSCVRASCRKRWKTGALIYGIGEDGWCCSPACANEMIARKNRARTRKARDPRQRPVPPPADELWPAAALRAVAPEWRARIYRAMARVLHPDAGGDGAQHRARSAGDRTLTTCNSARSAPIDDVIRRLDGVRGRRATCPACSHKGALAFGEGQAGQALVHCFVGCDVATITAAIGLAVSDLFAGDARERDRERLAERQRFAHEPRLTMHETFDRELDAYRARLRSDLGYDRPLRASDHNTVLRGVCRMFDLAPPPAIEPFVWEGFPPHEDDPSWPLLFTTALDEQVRKSYHGLYPSAQGWETDAFVGPYDLLVAAQTARKWLAEMAA